MNNRTAIIVTLLCSVHIFGLYYNIADEVIYVLDGLGFAIMAWYALLSRRNVIKAYPDNFNKPLILFFIALFLSTVSCYVYHGQGILATIFAMRYLFYFAIYFHLRKLPLDKQWVEKLVIIGAVIYMIVFFTQVLVFPIRIVDTGRIQAADRGFLRFRIEGAGFLMLSAFLSLNRFLLKRHWKNLAFFLLCMFALLMLGFRTLLLTAMISTYFLVVRTSNNARRMVISTAVLGMILVGIYLIPAVNDYVNELVNLTSEQAEEGDDYIRFQTFDFLINKVNTNEVTLFFGNGFAQEDSRYGKLVLGGKDSGFIFQDLGLVGFAIIYGIFAFLVYLYIAIKAIVVKLPKDSQYLGVYFFYILISSITTVEAYRAGILGIQALALYLIDLSMKEQRKYHKK